MNFHPQQRTSLKALCSLEESKGMKDIRRNLDMQKNVSDASQDPGIDVPGAYLKMVNQVFTQNFDDGLQRLSEIRPKPFFTSQGKIYTNEIIIAISIHFENTLVATSIYASCDFDPNASSPTAEDVLAICVDGAGALYSQLMDPQSDTKKLAELAEASLSACEALPVKWTEVEINKKRVYLKADKTNLVADQAADDWLKKNDPKYAKDLVDEESEKEEFFEERLDKKKS